MPDRVPSLERISEALLRLGLLKNIDPDRVIVVAGTNGKGTVAKALEVMLLASGQRVGLYTSPHVESTTERICINGRPVTESEFVQLFNDVARKLQNLELSHFEMLTAMAVECFYERDPVTLKAPQVDWAIFEVGMGGTWDATNAIPHNIAVVTALGLDHTKFLGGNIVSVARNKFGIVGSKAQVFYHPNFNPSVMELRRSVEERTNSTWIESEILDYRVSFRKNHPEWQLGLKETWLPIFMQGRRGVENLSLAVTVFEGLGFKVDEEVAAALSSMTWPCRMQEISWLGSEASPVYFSGDHNEQGIQSLVEILQHYTSIRKIKILLGMGKDKDATKFWAELHSAGLPIEIHLTESPFRGMKIDDYGEVANRVASTIKDPIEALHRIESSLISGEMLVVTGSLYLVGFLVGQQAKLERLKGQVVRNNTQFIVSPVSLDRARID